MAKPPRPTVFDHISNCRPEEPEENEMCQPIEIDVDKEFAIAVRTFGGEVVEDLVPPEKRTFSNADFFFRSQGVIAELKRLSKDSIGDPNIRKELRIIFDRLALQGRIPATFRKRPFTLRELAEYDEMVAMEFIQPYKKRLDGVINKANRQNKETANYFQISNPRGLLLLCNDGDFVFEMGLLEIILSQIFNGKYRNISTVIYFTVNATVSIPEIHPFARIWRPYDIPNRPTIDEQLLSGIRDAWFARMAIIEGLPSAKYTIAQKDDPLVRDAMFTSARVTKL